MRDPFRAREEVRRAKADVRSAWSEVKTTAKPVWPALVAFIPVAYAAGLGLVWLLRWFGLGWPWWTAVPLAAVLYYPLLAGTVRLALAVGTALQRRWTR